MSRDSLTFFLSPKTFHVAIPSADPKLLKSMFIKASSDVQQSVIENMLLHFASKDKYDAFRKLVETKIIEPKRFHNGETLLTNLLKVKNVKYCRAIIFLSPNKQCLNLANILNQIPLQVAIETDLYDLIYPLIVECDNLSNEDINGYTPLMQLFQKLSNSTDVFIDYSILFNTLIC